MLKNNNKSVINDLVKNSLKHSKKRNALTIVAIALTTFLLTTVFFIGVNAYNSYSKAYMRINGTSSEAYLTNPTDKQIDQIKNKSYVESIGKSTYCAISNIDNFNLGLFYEDTHCFNMTKEALWGIKGTYPDSENKIMLSQNTLKKLGIKNPKIGQKISLKYSNDLKNSNESNTQKEKTFILSGWFSSDIGNKKQDLCYVSKDFCNKMDNKSSTANMMFVDGNKKDYFNSLKKDMGSLKNQNLEQRSKVDFSTEKNSSIFIIAILLLFIMFTGYLLIYNVFYISAIKDIQSYGLLKALGTTEKQLKSIIYKKAKRLAVYGILIGAIIGVLLSYYCLPALISKFSGDSAKIAYWSFYPLIPVGAMLFSFITVLISAKKPAKVVGKITAIEAIKYMSSKGKSIKINTKKEIKNKSVISSMAYRNVFSNKKRARIVFLSLVLGLTTFMCITTLIKSMDVDKYVDSMQDGDISIENDYVKNENGEHVKGENLTPDLISNIKEIDGVENVYKQSRYEYKIDYTNEFDNYAKWLTDNFKFSKNEVKNTFKGGNLVGINPEMLEKCSGISKKDLKEFKEGKKVYINKGYEGNFTLPKDFTVRLKDLNKTVTLENGGYIKLNIFLCSDNGKAPNLIMSSDKLNELIGNKSTKTSELYVYLDESNQEKTNNNITEYLDGIEGVKSSSKQDIHDEFDFMTLTINVIGGGFSLVLVFIGLMNFVNIMVSSIEARKGELSVMESIGMTKNQINKMLQKEGLYYSGLSLAVVWTLGTALSYLMVYLIKGSVSYVSFDFPILAMLLVSVLVFIICFLIPRVSIKSLFKEPLTQRIRTE